MNINLINKTCESLELLKNYKGTNPYIIDLKNKILVYKSTSLNAFSEEYLRTNYNREPKPINKIVKLADWFGEYKQEDWGVKAEKLYVAYYMGETSKHYHVYGKYRRSIEGYQSLFIPKDVILTDFLAEDYNKLNINFDKYNKKSGLTLKPHQEKGVKFLLTRKKGILSAIMGSGKTITAIVAALEGKFNKVLIVCPASVKTTWKHELEYFVDNNEITIVEGSKWKENKFTIINFDILDNFYDIPTQIVDSKKRVVDDNGKIHYETVKKEIVSRKKEIVDKAMADSQLFQSNFDLIIIDEAHKLSNKTSNRTKIILDLIKRSGIENVFALTGTMLTNSPVNYFSMLKLIDAPISKDWIKYALRYCDGKQIYNKKERDIFTNIFLKEKHKQSWYDLTYDEKQELNEYLNKKAKKILLANGASNLEELAERTKHLYFRETNLGNTLTIKKEIKVLNYDLSIDEQAQYNAAWEEYIISRGESTEDALKKLLDNRKLIEGSVFRMMLADFMVSRSIKLAEEHIAKGDKVIIFCAYDKELYALKDYFKDRCEVHNGKLTAKKKDEAIKRFKEDDNCMALLGNLGSTSVGLTLVNANVIIFNSCDYTPAINEQSEYRILRYGQQKQCYIYYQGFKNTYTNRLFEILDVKSNIINNVVLSEDEK